MSDTFGGWLMDEAAKKDQLIAELRERILSLERNANNPTFDATDAAHPAWWRGQAYGAKAICSEVNKILDGEANESGVANEPWESTRRRLFALMKTNRG